MNLSTNNINFEGKKEIIYGLKKAAQESKKIAVNESYNYGPRPINKSNDIALSKGALSAYFDMIMNDRFINQGIKEAAEDKELMSFLKETLCEQTANNIKINPLTIFANNLKQCSKNQTEYFKKTVENFINKIGM